MFQYPHRHTFLVAQSECCCSTVSEIKRGDEIMTNIFL